MWTSRLARLALVAATGATVATVLTLWSAASPAAATAPSGTCLLPGILCPTTTVPKTTSTTAAPVTTAPPTTAHPTTATTTAHKTTATTAAARKSSGAASVGVAGLPVTGSVNLPAIGTGSDPLAPQLAGTPSPTTATLPLYSPPTVLSGLLGSTTAGLPNDHATPRIVLSLLALAIGVLAAAQLPASRRTPRALPPPPD